MRQDPRFVGYRFIWFIKNHKEKNIHIEGAEIKEYLQHSLFLLFVQGKIMGSELQITYIYL